MQMTNRRARGFFVMATVVAASLLPGGTQAVSLDFMQAARVHSPEAEQANVYIVQGAGSPASGGQRGTGQGPPSGTGPGPGSGKGSVGVTGNAAPGGPGPGSVQGSTGPTGGLKGASSPAPPYVPAKPFNPTQGATGGEFEIP